MTIDERLERLTERHESLTLSVESLTHDINRMRILMDDMMVSIARLARVAEVHEHRISHLEDNK
ncbi:MAG TPA: hypothetical protein VKX41_15050 [Alloacidobacterium sp.]|jgi:archaellum component FlaC|nr:hypothetical protein [Alloacidobacterium sp.]